MHLSCNGTRRALLAATLLGLSVSAGAASIALPAGDKIIISGASGQLGELTIKELLKRGVPAKQLILISRTPEKLSEYAKLGAVTRFGDVDKPESLPAAYAGGTRMLMISLGFAPGNPPRPPRHKIAFDAAVRAGVKYIAYTSYIGADKGGNMLADDHKQSEEFLRASGAKWTALRNGFYADGLLQRALAMAKSGQATVVGSDAQSAPVTRADCAAAAAGALLGGDTFANQGFDITGPALTNNRELAKLVGEIIGRPITIVEQAAAPGRGGGAGAAPSAPVMSDAVAKLAGRPATSVRAMLEANKAQLLAAAGTTKQ